ncbi:MAG: murein transglycosylase A [Myxococcota bacterium]|nr:murein transglycosylase A [Myxococcota bacterium]
MRTLIALATLCLSACPHRDGSLYRFSGDGRLTGLSQIETWKADAPNWQPPQQPSAGWKLAIKRHLSLIGRARNKTGERINVEQRRAVAQALSGGFEGLKGLQFLRLKGDGSGNVQFTGYYTPIIDARRQADDKFRHALYAYPKAWQGKGPHLSRGQIDDQGRLSGQGLELAYSADPSDNFFMQVQGSGMVRYADGSLEMLAYAGKNGHAYVSVGRLLVERGRIAKADISMNSIRSWCAAHRIACQQLYNENPSYVFFRRGASGPVGASGEIVSAGLSIAVDPRVIPLGSTLVAHLPVLDGDGKLSHHEWRILLAQDTGGAIKGSAHIDLYTGVGGVGARAAQALHHYGRIWLILPSRADLLPGD